MNVLGEQIGARLLHVNQQLNTSMYSYVICHLLGAAKKRLAFLSFGSECFPMYCTGGKEDYSHGVPPTSTGSCDLSLAIY